MEVRDPIHGAIHIGAEVVPIIKHPFFQRLRNIKQLGLSEYIFPGATHTRYLHSLGVMWVGDKVFSRLFQNNHGPDFIKLKETFKLACLLHDIGHAPLSHATEMAMPPLVDLKLPKEFLAHEKNLQRQSTHEDYTIKAITDSSFAESFYEIEKKFGVDRFRIADLITGQNKLPEYFKINGLDYFPLLSQLVSSELDCDRMDYLLRDSFFCGVSYGRYDIDWLIDNMEICTENGQAFLGLSERAIVTFDDFLLGRYHMFLMVYFHYRAVCLEQILGKYFASAPNEYRIPPDIEEYIDHDDYFLIRTIKQSKNTYAMALAQNIIPPKIYESFNSSQLKILTEIQTYLEKNLIEHIRSSSTGRLSKYYNAAPTHKGPEIKVIRNVFGKKLISPLSKATDLFEKFSHSHAVNRLHFNMDELDELKQKEIRAIIMSDLGLIS